MNRIGYPNTFAPAWEAEEEIRVIIWNSLCSHSCTTKMENLEMKKEAAKVTLNGAKSANYGSWGPLFKNSQHFTSLHYS
ncbi:unnamed protein product [Nezara viridula]|uniref:Uncharacterized protein n=1 Tax=Nezara viridula TaxID=85310 RepID=A0A9P0H9Y7_NEZVI|nr:unnamed protein product [Nezara viridula]